MTEEEVSAIRGENWDWFKEVKGIAGSYIMTSADRSSASLVIMHEDMDLDDYLMVQERFHSQNCLVIARAVSGFEKFSDNRVMAQFLDERESK